MNITEEQLSEFLRQAILSAISDLNKPWDKEEIQKFCDKRANLIKENLI